jgi:hypothetical protein
VFKATALSIIVSWDLTASEFCRGVKHDKTHSSDLKVDKYFNTWKRGIIATAFIHHTQHILDGEYTPVTLTEVGLFRETQIFMYAVFEEMLKTVKGKYLVSAYKSTRDAQAIYKELAKHTTRSTVAQLSGDRYLPW